MLNINDKNYLDATNSVYAFISISSIPVFAGIFSRPIIG
jgi:hypothetical protein